jgi:hypothetical protein
VQIPGVIEIKRVFSVKTLNPGKILFLGLRSEPDWLMTLTSFISAGLHFSLKVFGSSVLDPPESYSCKNRPLGDWHH